MATRAQILSDLTACEAAIRRLITTREPVEFSHDNETLKFNINELPQLQALKKELREELAAATPGGCTNYATFRRPR